MTPDRSGRRLLVRAPGDLELAPYACPEPADDELLVSVDVSLISPGTETRVLRGEPMAAAVWDEAADLDLTTVRPASGPPPPTGPGTARFPATLGYNAVGTVIAAGRAAAPALVGRRVMTLGRHQTPQRVAAWEAVPVPSSLPAETATFAYLSTLGLHALREAGFVAGQSVAVLGAGVVGALAALMARAIGAAEVILAEPRAERRARLQGIAGLTVLTPAEAVAAHAGDAAVVVEAAGGAGALDTAVELVARGGTIAVVALHPEPLGPRFDGAFYAKEIRFTGSANAPYAPPGDGFTALGNVAFALELLARGALDPDPLISHRLPVERAADGYAALADDPGACAVLLDWSG
jgi:2-desacetyl-2-hydroxyethyl bacteriochlorophyllide A dehydrogenase